MYSCVDKTAELRILEEANNLPVMPSMRKLAAVNGLRHHRMDSIVFDVKDDDRYIAIYTAVMTSISTDYPSLSGEVERQVSKKRRRQERFQQKQKDKP